ncbi:MULTISPECIES: hypothetical protein [Sphingobacterium]|uniref:Uncharacterized protein n=1 Tax=Sphingobacterium detergens TaxID=1145106 RepID=A0A420BFJ5_SPHD1|nr:MULTISPECIES: hypothetical protein [Sphingobacterium]MCS4225961.1 hypothetical protein [Sphingobacterium sp. BIGb0165]RKE55463.1 hypothetical protein DFQ12_0295 [Sphingobacterium detergens]
MAISKQATNIKIRIQSGYNLQVAGKVQKLADQLNFEAREGNLILASNKKVHGRGNKEG